ncbi:MAG: TRAM domain-containing protein [Chloroflexi bacterium]|nr:MAG: TRAM domain-containing protein [Chloroflexota bacterium]
MTKLIQILGALLGTIGGLVLGLLLMVQAGGLLDPANRPAFLTAFVVASLLFGYLAIPYITVIPTRWAIAQLAEAGAGEYALGVVAILVGLVMGLLLGVPLSQLGGVAGSVLPPIVALVLVAVMLAATLYKRDVLIPAAAAILPGGRRRMHPGQVVVDTSAVIDGRIVDIGRTGFILGTLVVPRFVLDELQRIADSPDPMRRNRGRRGLEMLSALQKDAISPVEISEQTYPEIGEVDAKLVAYAREHAAAILTNDFNLNRVAELQGIRVLNINELANAVKAVLHPGEELTVRIIQEGKEPGQGVGYLDDGTMIVVEGGSRSMDHDLNVTVTRVLQTVAGRMIFAQPRDGVPAPAPEPTPMRARQQPSARAEALPRPNTGRRERG